MGTNVGSIVGYTVGLEDGPSVGSMLGFNEGSNVGLTDGYSVGFIVGTAVGCNVGGPIHDGASKKVSLPSHSFVTRLHVCVDRQSQSSEHTLPPL